MSEAKQAGQETKAIRVSPDLHEEISIHKIKGGYSTLSEVIEDNLILSEGDN